MKHLSILLTMLFFASQGFAKGNESDTINMQNLDEVIVSASRTQSKVKELPYKVEVITAKALRQSPYNNLADVLKRCTSVDIVQYPNYSTSFGFRGFAPHGHEASYVKVIVNGLPSGTVNLSTLALSDVEQIEVLKGPFSSLYGKSTMGGLVNIVTKKHTDKITGAVNVGYGSFDLWNLNANVGGKIAGGLSFDASAFYTRSDDYSSGNKNFYSYNKMNRLILGEKSYDKEMKNTGADDKGGSLRLGYDFNENWSFDVYQSIFLVDDLFTNNGYSIDSPGYLKDMTHYNVQANLQGKIGNNLMNFKPYYSTGNDVFNNPTSGIEDFESTTDVFGFQLQDKITLGKHNLTFGVDNENTQYKSEKYDSTNGTAIAPYKPDYDTNTLGAFVQMNFKLNKLGVSLGGRYDYMKFKMEADSFLGNSKDDESYSTFNPNIGLKYNFDEHTAAHASFGTAFLAPTALQKAGEFTISGSYIYNGTVHYYDVTTKGNADLDPEKSNTFDVGFSYKNREQGLDLDITYFNTHHNDKIVKSTLDQKGNYLGYTTYFNAEKGRMDGLELALSYDFGVLADYDFSLKAFFNSTLLFNAKTKNDGANWVSLASVRKHTAIFGLNFTSQKHWNIKLGGRYLGSKYITKYSISPELATLITKNQPNYATTGLVKYPQAMVFDASVYYNINKHFTLGVNANNIFDENYAEQDGYNMPSRNFMGKVSYKF